jgi:site-specific DNA recombinase
LTGLLYDDAGRRMIPTHATKAGIRYRYYVSLPPSRKSRQILIPLGVSRNEVRPTPIERRARLVNAIARGRRWLDEVVSGSVTDVQQIAARQKCSVRQVNMTISLAFLAPDLVRAAVEGRLPRGIGVERLRDAPAEWSRQFEALGLDPQ